jgi:hypothetical protein
MLTRILCSAYVVLSLAALAWAQGSPAGHWEGAFSLDNREVGVSLDLARNKKSEWIASMGIPSEKMTGMVVLDVMVSESSVSFVAVMLQMAKVDLTFSQDGKMKGTISFPRGPQGSLPIEFKRTGEASVELIPASPAVSKDLEGDWEGSLRTPNRAFRVIFHFKNQPDKTVAATIDTPETNAIGLPLNDVKQSGQKVEVAIKVANSSFQGTLNKESTELTGEWVVDGNRMPLTLRKK